MPKLREIAEFVHAQMLGNGELEVHGIASIPSASSSDLVFVEDKEHLDVALESAAAAVLSGEFAVGRHAAKPLLIASQPRLAFARAARLLRPVQPVLAGIHPSAILHATVVVGAEASVAERVIIQRDVEIGDRTSIGAGCVIGEGCKIGAECVLYANVTLYPGVRLGKRVMVHSGAVLGSDGFGYVRDLESGRYEKFPQIGRLEIEDDVEIGANATVDRGALDVTRIGRGTKIDNLVHVGHNVEIGEDVVIAAQTGLSGSAVVEKNVIIGGQVGIADHVRIEEGAILGAQSGIPTKKVIRGKGVIFWGTPARPIREYLRELAVLARLAKRD